MLSILIPCKEEPKIQQMLAETERLFPEAEIIVCNDRDGRGKGWALREALNNACGDIICFIDGDFDIDPKMINRLLPFVEEHDVILGKRIIRGKIIRKAVSFLSRVYIRLFFGLLVETQCGLKIFKRKALPEWKEDGFMYDLEIVTKARDAGFRIIEVPIEVTPYGATSKKIRLEGVVRCFIASLKIWWNRIL